MVTASPTPMKASSQATTALVLGIIGLVCCQIVSPFAWYMGNKERQAIRDGRSSPAGEGFATAGMILGILGSIALIFILIWFAFGGLAILGALMAEATQ